MKQVTKFYLTSFLKNQTYFTPILILFLQLNHLNYQQIFWVFTIASIFSLVIEIPTGIFADLYGKRKSIIISKFGIFVSYILFGLSNNFWMFLLSQVVYELGNSFRTGTETAYTYEYLRQNKKNNPSYTEVKGKQKFYARVSESLAALAGGFLAKLFGYNWVFIIAAIPAFLNFLIAVGWEKIKEGTDGKINLKDSIKHAKRSLVELFKKPNLFKITMNIMLFAAIVAALQKFIQPYMVEAGIAIEYFGIIYSVALGLAAFVVMYSYILEDKFGTINTINIMSFLGIVPLIILGLGHVSLLGVGLFFFVIIIENIRSPIANNEFHNLVKSKQRATLGSIMELFKSLGNIIILPIMGYFADVFSIYTAIMILAGILIINSVFFYVRKEKIKV